MVHQNCLVIVMICTGGRHRSVMCTELVNRLASLQGIECCAVHLCQSTWGRICSSCEHCSWSTAPRCDLAKLRDQNLRNIIELIQNNLAAIRFATQHNPPMCGSEYCQMSSSTVQLKSIAEVERQLASGSKALALFSRELCRKAHIVGASLKGGREDFHRKGGKIAEIGR